LSKLSAEMVVDLLVVSDPRVSPDGEFVAFVVVPMGRRGEHPEAAVWLAPTDSSAPARKLTAGTANDRAPRWSPDGCWLYFLSDRAERGKAQLYRLPAREGSEAEALTAWKPGVEGASSPSPTARRSRFFPGTSRRRRTNAARRNATTPRPSASAGRS
jgi:Tol biopolymer transport system component